MKRRLETGDSPVPIKIAAIPPLNKGYIAYVSLRMLDTAIFLLPV